MDNLETLTLVLRFIGAVRALVRLLKNRSR